MKMNIEKIIVFFLVLAIFSVEAHDKSGSGKASDSSCPKKNLDASLKDIESKCKEFAKSDIGDLLKDSTISGKDKECVTKCSDAYRTVNGVLKTAIQDLKLGRYGAINQELTAIPTLIEPCKECLDILPFGSPETKQFPVWTMTSVGVLSDKFKPCKEGH